MDSNEKKNHSVSVPELDKNDVKIEQAGACENSNIVKDIVDSQLAKIFGSKSKDTQKRKAITSSEIDMENDDSLNSSESVKRKRYSYSQNETTKSCNSESDGEKVMKYTLFLTNSPGEWTPEEIISFVKKECGVNISSINDSREENNGEDFQIRLRFDTNQRLQQVLTQLRQQEQLGKLTVHLMNNVKDELKDDAESEKTLNVEEIICSTSDTKGSVGPSKPDEDENSAQTDDYYISENFLETLDIKPPITNWIHVTNFRCDKSELKEVLGLAGKVLICSVCMNPKYANVKYSHPLEAVQAVSMLNGQQYYGKALKVKMHHTTENSELLPKGLVDVGPGLGKYGRPIPDLPDQYKQLLKGEASNLNTSLFKLSFLKKLGTAIDENVQNVFKLHFQHRISQDETDSERDDSPIENENTEKSPSRNFGPIGQKPVNMAPVSRPQIISTISHGLPKQVPNPMAGSILARNIRACPIGGPQGPRSGPMHSPVMGPRGPVPVVPGPRPGFPVVNTGPMFISVPPVPGFEPSNESRNINGMTTGPRLSGQIPGPISPMVGPRGPMPANRFPGPGPIMGPRPGPVLPPHRPMGVPNCPTRPNTFFGANVQIFKGRDPLAIQITNLPLTTNFVNLGQKLSEFGHVVFLELTTPGCASVRFASPADVDRCLQNYCQVMP